MTARERAKFYVYQFKGFEMPNEEFSSKQVAEIQVKNIISVLERIPFSISVKWEIQFHKEVLEHIKSM